MGLSYTRQSPVGKIYHDVKGVTFIMPKLAAYLRRESGASAAEYALILAIIGAALFVALLFLSSAIGGAVNTAANCLNSKGTNC